MYDALRKGRLKAHRIPLPSPDCPLIDGRACSAAHRQGTDGSRGQEREAGALRRRQWAVSFCALGRRPVLGVPLHAGRPEDAGNGAGPRRRAARFRSLVGGAESGGRVAQARRGRRGPARSARRRGGCRQGRGAACRRQGAHLPRLGRAIHGRPRGGAAQCQAPAAVAQHDDRLCLPAFRGRAGGRRGDGERAGGAATHMAGQARDGGAGARPDRGGARLRPQPRSARRRKPRPLERPPVQHPAGPRQSRASGASCRPAVDGGGRLPDHTAGAARHGRPRPGICHPDRRPHRPRCWAPGGARSTYRRPSGRFRPPA